MVKIPGGASGKESARHRLGPWVGKIPWRRKWQSTPVFLPGESQTRGSLVGCSLWGRTESDTTNVTKQQWQTVPTVIGFLELVLFVGWLTPIPSTYSYLLTPGL